MGAALVALASCSSEEVVDVNKGNKIDFRASLGLESETRSTETTDATLDKFYVSAYMGGSQYFKDVEFVKGVDGIFVSTPEFYWPYGKEVTFFAYSDYSSTKNVTASETSMTITDFSPMTDITLQHDLVGAHKTAKESDENHGQLQFDHLLSQIRIMAKNTNTNYTYQVVGVQIGNVGSKANFTLTGDSKSWTSVTGSEDYSVDYPMENGSYIESKIVTLGSTAVDIMNMAKEGASADDVNIGNAGAMLIPQSLKSWKPDTKNVNTGAYIAVKIKLTMAAEPNTQIYPETAGEYAYAYIPLPENSEWLVGNCYTYTLDFSEGAGYDEKGDPILGGPIRMTTQVSGWNPVTPEDIKM